jgi:hypothetical protein
MEGILTGMDEACMCYIPTFKNIIISKDIVAKELLGDVPIKKTPHQLKMSTFTYNFQPLRINNCKLNKVSQWKFKTTVLIQVNFLLSFHITI